MRLLPARPVLLTTLLALAGCSSPSGPTANDSTNNAVDGNATESVNYVAAVEALSDDERKAVFFRAIRDAGVPCQIVVKAEKTEPWQGLPSWLADCDTGDQHLIQLKPDGSANVVSRTTR
ncbi:hypothetical protein [Sphingobium sp. CR28]|uniref:hypothetical protein n=1 Tax=Sphingobium sp. CR28 TaxID=3400272 RepID=UPI003FF0FEBD